MYVVYESKGFVLYNLEFSSVNWVSKGECEGAVGEVREDKCFI